MDLKNLKEELSTFSNNFDSKEFYYDINVFSKKEKRTIVDKDGTNASNENEKGFKIRVWDNEKFLEYGSNKILLEEIENNLKKLITKAINNQDKLKIKSDLEIQQEEIKQSNIKISENKNTQEISKLLDEIKEEVNTFDNSIVNVRCGLIEEEEGHIFTNKNKSLAQNIPLKILIVIAYIKCDDGSIRMGFESFANNNFDVFKKYENLKKDFREKINNIKKSKKLPGGKYNVILSPRITGLLAHESFGHGMEADTMMKGRALATSWQGKKIGSQEINIVDYPAIEGKNGEFYFDHEGNLARKTYLVKNGIINEPIADLYSKMRLNLKNSSNSRAQSYDHKNYTRMSNTYFEAGDIPKDELISQIEDGIYIQDSNGGMEDPKGWGVQIQGCFGQKIKNGKLIEEFYDGFTITGFLPDIVSNIKGISKEFEIDGAGSCGKGHKEWVRVSEGGPYLFVKNMVLG